MEYDILMLATSKSSKVKVCFERVCFLDGDLSLPRLDSTTRLLCWVFEEPILLVPRVVLGGIVLLFLFFFAV